jgi:hypothetical protein
MQQAELTAFVSQVDKLLACFQKVPYSNIDPDTELRYPAILRGIP